ncbi:hypothetical protein BCR41DRAFT_387169 [Lobosporangium transversale]|uniref:Uncharacterized protein n=1 Tax=Lobosporangium transversale TaxID=64571 RepID=A0A1Y2GK06_9FUNG|nr:hypothetical protein BCR41DRAFT_387169 [Lobosporangium transversale]ORZ13326.1 hypothetical protein BCR41DRAFT_387169 [Lobosporangium transversale]|eukprot:XP_021880407.1 hypothetical protein BCR41DRAFT_387169 [Lobosporangium transversale]
MPSVQSKLSIYRKLIPAKYVNRIALELQRTFLVALSLLKAHRRKAILLSLGPATIFKFVTVMLPIIKLLPPTVKAIRALSYFKSSSTNNGNRNRSSSNNNSGDDGSRIVANREANTTAAAAEGLGLSMDELSEILWTPAEDTYWERVNAVVSRFGLHRFLGISLAGVRPGRVEVIMPFKAEVSGEGGTFHVSLLPTLIAITSQLTGMTLLPRHFTLKPIDLKCNILSDCDASTYLLLARGAVVVRGEHSITIKVEIMKASGLVPGSTEIISPSPRPSMLSWKSCLGASTTNTSSVPISPGGLVPGTCIERSRFVLCASGMQTSVIVRASMDHSDEGEFESQQLKREEEQKFNRRTSSMSSTSTFGSPAGGIADEDVIILGDSFQPTTSLNSTITSAMASSRKASAHNSQSTTPRPTSPTIAVAKDHSQPMRLTNLMDSSSFQIVSPSSSFLDESKHPDHDILQHHQHTTILAGSISNNNSTMPMTYAAAVRQQPTGLDNLHQYEETSDTEAWQKS